MRCSTGWRFAGEKIIAFGGAKTTECLRIDMTELRTNDWNSNRCQFRSYDIIVVVGLLRARSIPIQFTNDRPSNIVVQARYIRQG